MSHVSTECGLSILSIDGAKPIKHGHIHVHQTNTC